MSVLVDAAKRQTLRWARVLLVGLGVGMSSAHAQAPPTLPVIAILEPSSAAGGEPIIRSFKQSLAELGWVEGRNVRFETRYADHQPDRLAQLAREIVALKPDLIFTQGPTYRLVAQATSTIPIVFGVSGDVVAAGLAKSLARPGGNVTGMTLFIRELDLKQLGIMKETVPTIRRVGVLMDTAIPSSADQEMAEAARPLGLQLQFERVSAPAEFPAALNALKKAGAEALFVMTTPMLAQASPQVAALALALRLPSVSGSPTFAESGGMLQYGADVIEMIRKSAGHADKILRGAKPGDLPIEQPTRFEFVVNLKTAKALGLKPGPAVLARADRVIE